MTNKQAARKYASIANKLQRLAEELRELQESVPGWEHVGHRAREKVMTAFIESSSISGRLAKYESSAAEDEASRISYLREQAAADNAVAAAELLRRGL